jgi:hypothetical protein
MDGQDARMIMRKQISLFVLLTFVLNSIAIGAAAPARDDGRISNGPVAIGKKTAPDASAVLDVTSTTKGMLPPRMTQTQRDAISSPATGLQVYNTTSNKLNVYNGTSWVEVGSGAGSSTNLLTNGSFDDASATNGWTVSNGTCTADTGDHIDDGGAQSLSCSLSSVNGVIVSQSKTATATGLNFENTLWVKTSSDKIQVCSSVNSVEQQCLTVSDKNIWLPYSPTSVTVSGQTVSVYAKTVSSTTATVKIDAGYLGLNRNLTNGIQFVATTVQKFLSGSGTYTTPNGVRKIRVRMVGGGGGGAGSGTSASGGNGGNGGDTTFGTNTAGGGGGATAYNGSSGAAGGGGTATLSVGLGIGVNGGEGFADFYNGSMSQMSGSSGGSSALGGAGRGAIGAGGAGKANTGGGGGGGGGAATAATGSGGGAGAYLDFIISNPSTTYSYAVGAAGNAGSAGTSGSAGGAGGSGVIIVEEDYGTVETAFRPPLLAISWSGYHDSTCAWARTNTSYGDPAADASCALVESTNRNFGTVTTSGSALPGITFTPARAGRYYVCASTQIYSSTAAANASVRLWDGTTTLMESGASNSTLANSVDSVFPMRLCGILDATSTASKTVSLQSKATGTATVNIYPASLRSAVEWTIFAIDSPLPALVLTGNVTSNSSGMTRTEYATITCSSSSSVSDLSTTGWISVGNISSGTCAVTFSAPFGSVKPKCVPASIGASGTTFAVPKVSSQTVNGFNIISPEMTSGSSTISAATAFTVDVICFGPR